MSGNKYKIEKFSPRTRLISNLKEMGKDRVEKIILEDFVGKRKTTKLLLPYTKEYIFYTSLNL